MEQLSHDWLGLILRWMHVLFAMAWIGASFYFMWLDASLDPPSDPEGKRDVEGELWMVHSGGFYLVEKKKLVPERMPPILHWFKYEALFTGVTGWLLLITVYYFGGGVFLLDPTVSSIGAGSAIALCVSVVFGGWLVYDLLWASSLARRYGPACLIACLVAAVAIAYGLGKLLSGRAAFIHVGALFGTIMVVNVWRRILPAQRALIQATKEGRAPDSALAAAAKQRSIHNNYLTFPVVFIMISNHYHGTYGSELGWLILALLMVAGASVRHFLNKHVRWALVPAAASLAAALYLTLPEAEEAPEAKPAEAKVPTKRAIDPAATGVVKGVVRLEGTPPPPKEVALSGGCEARHEGPVIFSPVRVSEGRLADAFVALTSGTEEFEVPPAPDADVEIDQKGCIYQPRVLGVRAGQTLTFVNSDPILHNVRGLAKVNKSFNLAMPAAGMRISRRFTKPELMVTVKCDVHPWMAAHVGVVDHPWFAVTKEDGAFALEGVPAGEYTLAVWHEAYRIQERRITVEPRAAAELELVFRAE